MVNSKKNYYLFAFLAALVVGVSVLPNTFRDSIAVKFLATTVIVSISSILLLFRTVRSELLSTLPYDMVFWLYSIGIVLSQFLASTSNVYGTYGLVKTVGYVLTFTLVYYVISYTVALSGRKFWSIIAIISSVISLFAVLASLGILRINSVYYSTWTIPVVDIRSSSSIFWDANYYALLGCVGVISSIFSYQTVLGGGRLKKSLWFMVGMVSLLGVIVSYSRTGYVALFAVCMYYSTKKFRLGTLIAFIVVLIMIAYVHMPNVEGVNKFIQINRLGTGRLELWKAGYKAVVEKPIYGWGLGNIGEALKLSGINRPSTHNTILDIFVQGGMLGAVPCIYLIVKSIFGIRKIPNNKYKKFVVSMLIVTLMFSQLITFFPGGVDFGSVILVICLGQIAVLADKS